MSAETRITSFVEGVRSRLERVRGARVGSLAFFTVALALALWCLGWVIRGYAVPRGSYAVAALAFALLTLVGVLVRRTTRDRAARVADEHFGLKDALVSFLGFAREHQTGELYQLDADQTASRVDQLDATAIPFPWPKRILGAAVVLMLAAAVMAFRSPSPAVLEKLATEEETTRKTTEINKELEEQVEEMLKQATEEEKTLLQPQEWRQWLKELEQTKDRKEAMRQYAELEQKLQEAAQKLNPREQEQLLAKAGEELQQDAENRETGRKLEEKNYREAAADLKKLQLQSHPSKPNEARKELARLKSAAQRLSSAARSFRQRSGKQSQGQGSSGSPSLDQQMMDLDQAAQQYDKSLQSQSDPKQCQQCQSQCNSSLNQLCQSLCKSACQRDLMKKLLALSKCAGKCQGYLGNKQCQSLGQCLKPGQSPGGKQAGSGTVESRRSETELTRDNGNRDQLQGIKGQGPSQTTSELADSGSGAASHRSAISQREWKRQVESFIQREDVPTEVKAGVKEYFNGIQGVGEQKRP